MDRFGDKICCNPTVKLKKQESYPVIDIDKITPGYKAVRSVASIEYTGQGGAKFQDHDVLFARITPCLENGKMAIADTEGQNGIGSTELFVFRGIDGVSDTDYVYYLLCMKHIRQLAANSMTGASGRQRADLDFIKRIQWDFPDIEMQKKIASVLSAYDNLIEVNNKRIKVLEQIAENLYKEWFVRFRFPGHEKADFENGIPKGWRRGRISEFYTTSSGGTPSRELDEYYVDGTIPWIKTGELQDCLLIDTEERITEVAVKKSSAKFFPKDSVLMAMYGVNIGMLAYSTMDATCNQACCVFRDKGNISTKHYLFQCLKSIRDYLLLISFGAAQQNLSQDLIKRVRIVMLDEETVIRFEQKIEPLYNEIKYMQRALTEYAAGDDGTEFPAKDIDQLIVLLNSAVDEADDFLLSLGIDIGAIVSEESTLDRLDLLRDAYNRIISNDENKDKFKVILNTLLEYYPKRKSRRL